MTFGSFVLRVKTLAFLTDSSKMYFWNSCSATIPEVIISAYHTKYGRAKTMLSRMGGDLSGGQQQIILEIEAAVRRIIETTGISVLLVEQHLHFVRQADQYYAMQKDGIVASVSTNELSQEVIQRFLAV